MAFSHNAPARADSAADAIDLLRDLDKDRESPAHSEVFYAVAEHTLIDLAEAAASSGGGIRVEFIDSGIEVRRDRGTLLTIQLRESATELNHPTVDLRVTDPASRAFIPIHVLRRERDPFDTCVLDNISVAQTHVLIRRLQLDDRFRFKNNGRTATCGWVSACGTDPQQAYNLPAEFLAQGLLERLILEDHDFAR